MRKGRSQRKTRGTLPPLSGRPPARPGAGPHVVIGLASSRSGSPEEPVIAETLAADRLEKVREQNLELVRETLDLVRESLADRASSEHAAPGDDHAESSDHAASSGDAEPEAAPFDLVESAPALLARAALMRPASLPTPSEMSIPPVGDLSVEPVAERFFSEGELVGYDRGPGEGDGEGSDESWDAENKAKRKSLPHVVERRARFAKYVRWAVGGAAVVCVAAFARNVVLGTSPGADHVAVNALEAPVAKAAPAGIAAPATSATPAAQPDTANPAEPASVEAPKVDVPTLEIAAAVPAAAAAVMPSAAASAPAVAAADGTKTAAEEKKDARRALERGKLADAIDAGERSVALDPADGEAWLLLGAAYQEKGKNAEARRCYASCSKLGKRGPIGECRAMLR